MSRESLKVEAKLQRSKVLPFGQTLYSHVDWKVFSFSSFLTR